MKTENRLIGMTDYVFLMREDKSKDNIRRFWACEKYAKFLRTPLELGMFVPCLDGVVLEEPEYFIYYNDKFNHWQESKFLNFFDDEYDFKDWEIECQKYQQAKERVLFEGFKINNESDVFSELWRLSNGDFTVIFSNFHTRMESKNLKTIEDLIPHNLTLTNNALKQIKT